MTSSFQVEVYKFLHQKVPYYGLLALLLTMVYNAITSKIDADTLSLGFGAVEWILIILIAVGSAFFAMEYSNQTMLMLLYKNTGKLKIYLAKFWVIFIYGLLLTLVAILNTVLLNFLLAVDIHSKTWVTDLLINMMGEVIYAVFIVGLSFMLIMLVRNNAVVICVGLALGFFGGPLAIDLMKTFPSAVNLLKWNPLNMIFISQQLTKVSYMQISHLTNSQLVFATLGYGLVFAILGYWLFKKRRI